MKPIIIIILTLFIINNSFSQRITTKLYGNILSHNWKQEESFYDNLSFGLEFKTKRDQIHELEVLTFYFNNHYHKHEVFLSNMNQVVDGVNTNTIKINLRYKYKILSIFEKNRFSSYLYASQLFIFDQFKIEPLVSTTYDTENSFVGTIFSVIPSINYNLKDLVYFNISIPIDLFEYKLKRSHTENPALSKELRTTTELSEGLYNKGLYLKLGIGFRIYEKKKTRYKDVLYL